VTDALTNLTNMEKTCEQTPLYFLSNSLCKKKLSKNLEKHLQIVYLKYLIIIIIIQAYCLPIRVYLSTIDKIFFHWIRFFSTRNVGVRLVPCLINCYRVFPSFFRIIVFQDQFFVLHALSVSHEITVLPLKGSLWGKWVIRAC